MEEWKDIPGYEGMYMVSSLGRVMSLERKCRTRSGERTVPCTIKKPDILKSGRSKTGLCKDGKMKMFATHRLVAEAFVPGHDEKHDIVNHKNENPLDNRAENLEWCDHRYNILYNDGVMRRWRTKLRTGANLPNNPKPVTAYKDGVPVKSFASLVEAANFAGVTSSAICYCLKHGKGGKCAGYSWEYAK